MVMYGRPCEKFFGSTYIFSHFREQLASNGDVPHKAWEEMLDVDKKIYLKESTIIGDMIHGVVLDD